ncbi:MAG: hypothetical protein WA160_04025 [Pseudobdellovibrio sp.]
MGINLFRFFVLTVFTVLLSNRLVYGFSIPQKYESNLLIKNIIEIKRFSKSEIDSNSFVEIKKKEWSACHQDKQLKILEIGTDESEIYNFLGNKEPLSNLENMETQKLQQGHSIKQAWSGDYWAYAKGILADRYLEPEFMALFDWNTRYQYVQKFPAQIILEKSGQDSVAYLSPSEKYDLIVGDNSFSLTNVMWKNGKKYFDATGNVEGWMGICHGWAAAAIMEPRPEHSFDILSYDQKWKIHLNPSEIKGLVSFNWANNSFPMLSLGERCDKKNPKRDANGRLTDPACFDLNPATWHLAVVNQLGQNGLSFVMDATYDYEVWNQPVVEYSYTYFNVNTNLPAENLQQASVQRKDLEKDKYAKYRSKNFNSIVGISMKVGYADENSSNAAETDSVEHDVIRWVQYEYDLEINSAGEAIGGEWHEVIHPDFIWTPKANVQPKSPYEGKLVAKDWADDAVSIPEKWSKAAAISSSNGFILDIITSGLLKKSIQ